MGGQCAANGEDGRERIEVSSWMTGCQRAKASGSKKFTLGSRATWPRWQEGPGSHLFPPEGSGRAGLSRTHYFKQEMDEDLLNGYPEEQLWFVRTSSADRPAIQVPIPPPKR